MSKSFHNYPDPREVIEKYGGDALRLYLMGSPTMAGQDMNVSEEGIKEQAKKTMLILWNCYNYFVTFATLHEFDSDEQNNHSNNILDKWLLSRINNFVKEFTKFMDDYHIPEAVRLLPEFLDDLSRWYIRRSRNRFEEGSKEALNTLFQTLNLFVKTTAPLIPFITEAIYQNIDKKLESIHLELWPKYDEKLINKQLEEEMKVVRKICEEGNALRKEKGFKLRQPLAGAIISGVEITEELQQVIKEELNIKKVEIKKTGNQKIELNTELTAELIAEGEAREIVRQIQEARKEAKCGLKSKIEAILPKWPKDFEEYIKEKTLTVNISKGEELTIREV